MINRINTKIEHLKAKSQNMRTSFKELGFNNVDSIYQTLNFFLEFDINSKLDNNTIFFLQYQYRTLRNLESRLVNVLFDKSNIKNWVMPKKQRALLKLKDDNKYKYINKQINYLDLSLLNILKILKLQHKISTATYKESIRRVKANKPLRERVQSRVSAYMQTIKSKSNKTNMSALGRFVDNREFIYHNGHKVILKSQYNKDIALYSKFKHQNDIDKVVNDEFKLKLKSCNKYI